MAILKFPPPPQLPKELGPLGQQLNRWLIEIQNILNAGGEIDPSSIAGLTAAYANIALLNTEVVANTSAIAANTANIAANTASINTLNIEVAANTLAIANLQARNQILNGAGAPGAGLGNNGDLYINNTGAAGSFLYGKIGGAWQVFA